MHWRAARDTVRRGDAIALALTLLTVQPAAAGPPYLTDDPVPVEAGHWEVYLLSDGAFRQSDFSGLGPAAELNYGAAPELQLHITVNGAFDAVHGRPGQLGLGDTELGFKYRLFTPGEDDWRPQLAIFPAIEVPTGDARRNLGAGHPQVYLPVWLQKDSGKWTVNAGGGYWINPGAGNKDYVFAGALLQRQVTEKLALGVEVFHQTASIVGRPPSSGFNVGAVYDFTEHYHALVSAGRGALAYAVDAGAVVKPFTYYAGVQWTF